jgi:1,2-diacylglycerol 3-alpha-glucosyltransferase
MRIANFTNAYRPTISGVVTSINLFRSGLIDKGHEVSVIAPEYAGFKDDEPYIFRVPAIDFSRYIDMTLAIPLRGPLERTMLGIMPHVIHSQHPIVMGNVGASFSRYLKIPLVFTFHTRYEEYAHKYIKFLPELAGMVMEEMVDRYLDHCTHIIAPTSSIRDLINRKYKVKVPVTVVPTPVDLSRYHHLEPERIRSKMGLQNCEVLLYVGRLSEEKNLSFLIKSFASLAHSRPKARLILVGRGVDEEDLRHLVDKMNLGDKVIFTGPIPHSEVPHYAAAANLFIFTSKTDTQGLVLIEAMAAGTPVVAVDADSSRDVLQNGGGILVPEKINHLCDVVANLLEDKAHLQALSDSARQIAQKYDIPSAVDRLVEVYQEAVSAYQKSKSK